LTSVFSNFGIMIYNIIYPFDLISGNRESVHMADVFISYKREDAKIVRRIVEMLRENEIAVWWDEGITPRQAWDKEIEQEILEASAVVVFWSQRSVDSEWVRTEAHYGKEKGKLVPAVIEPCTIPIAFTLTQTVNLSGWNGDRENRQWRKLLLWISDLVSTKQGAGSKTGLVATGKQNVYRNAIGNLPSGEPIYDGAFITPHTPPGTVFRDGDDMPIMRIVPKGLFLLGTTEDDPDRASSETPQKRIDIPASFAIGIFPILNSEFTKMAGSVQPAIVQPEPVRSWFGRFRTSPQQRAQAVAPSNPHPLIPMTNITYDEAQAFVDRLSSKSQQSYRIPSEAEWEYACRAGSATRYSCGNAIDSTRAAFALASGPVTVGVYPPNNFGLYDMHGNVREWTADLWHDSYDQTPQDGRAALEGHSSMRVVRGGSWHDSAAMLRSAARMRATQSIRSDMIGFRVARTVG
jgi:formylglycine-generating enzyme required for sulfatase activity